MKTLRVMFALSILTVSVHAFANPVGCRGNGNFTSPENPTAVLAVLGAAGAFVGSSKAKIGALIRRWK